MVNTIINSKTKENWIAKELAGCPEYILERLGEPIVREYIKKELELNINNCTDEAFGKRIFEFCQVEGTGPKDYLYRYLKTPFGEMMTSIRFIGGDMDKPAVFILHKTFDLKQLEIINEIGQIISKEYSIFKPKRFRWFRVDDEIDLIQGNANVQGDLIYVAEFIDSLKKENFPLHFDQIELKLTQEIFWYEKYKNTFEEMYKSWPEFIEMAQVESLEYLSELKEKQFLFDIYIQEKWAGIIAIDEGVDFYLNGYFVVEEFLMSDFKGKKYAAAVQRHLIEKLNSENNKMLFGTIHFGNIPSLKTAFRVGRKRVGTYIFAEL